MTQKTQNPAGGPGSALEMVRGKCRSLLCLAGFRVKVLLKAMLMQAYCRKILPRWIVQRLFNAFRLAHV
jgi:hypothetical protein